MTKFLLLCGLLTIATGAAAANVNAIAVPHDQLSGYWVMDNTSLYADVPNSGTGMSRPTCSAVTYLIGSDGVTRDVVARKTVPAGDLGAVAASTVKHMHYTPGANNADARQPVFTYIVIAFNLPADPAARAKIRAACTLKDFPNAYR